MLKKSSIPSREIFDSYDRNGHPLFTPLLRGEMPKKGYYHYVVEIYTVVNNHDILVTKRSPHKPLFPNQWEVTTGAVVAGESIQQAAIRELKEETGIEVSPSSLIDLYHTIDDDHQVLFRGFGVALKQYPTIVLQDEETIDYRWLSILEFRHWIATENFVRPIASRYFQFESILQKKLIKGEDPHEVSD